MRRSGGFLAADIPGGSATGKSPLLGLWLLARALFQPHTTAVKSKLSVTLLIAVITLGALASAWAEPAWETDLKKAQEQAKAGNKLVLLDFTGSDWCGWCIKLNREVFSKPEFKDYATKNLVLVELDFPRAKALAASLKKQNEELASQYGIQGFPTIIVLNGQGKKVGELGYMAGGPSAFIAELEKLRKG